MMNNYHYLISGLPQLFLDYESRSFSLKELLDDIKSKCSEKDIRNIELLFFGLEESNLTSHFYRASLRSKNRFISEYFKFDLNVRNIRAAYLARKSKQRPEDFLVGSNEVTETLTTSKAPDFGLGLVFEDATEVLSIMENKNILEREQLLDKLKWNRASEITKFNYFDLDALLAFLLKASLVERWAKMDKKTGEELFKKLVEEVRGTFDLEKVKNNN